MPTKYNRGDFEEFFNKEYPRDTFETEAVYEEYRRSAWMWYCLGYSQAQKDAGLK